jgi:hypothetical protein
VLRRALVVVAATVAAWGCGPALPDPESTGARVLRERCAGCHGVYAPGSMTFAMWSVQLDRMRRLYAQRGLPWLDPAEEAALVGYLRTHSGNQ